MIRYYKSILICITSILIILFKIDLNSSSTQDYSIAVNQVNLYSEPNIKSKILVELNYIDFIKIIKVRNKVEKINNIYGKWAYVKTTRGSESCGGECEGWLFDYYIAFPKKFKRVTNWEIKEFKACAGDFCPHYFFNSDGSFIMRLSICLGSDCEENKKKNICLSSGGKYLNNSICEYKGQLYKYLNLIKAKKYKSNSSNYLFYTDNGYLCLPESSDPCIKAE